MVSAKRGNPPLSCVIGRCDFSLKPTVVNIIFWSDVLSFIISFHLKRAFNLVVSFGVKLDYLAVDQL